MMPRNKCDECDKPYRSQNDKPSFIRLCECCKGASEVLQQTKMPLLTIQLEDESSVPKVFYQGEEITGGKARVLFNWETEKAMPNSGGMKFDVEYADVVDGKLIQKRVGLTKGKYIQEDKVPISFKDLTEAERQRLSEKLRTWFD